jgi:pilus assembly protein CpaF
VTQLAFVDRVRQRLALTASEPALGAAVRDEQSRASVIADDAALAAIERDVAADVIGAGPLEPLLALPGVSDVLVNGPEEVWLDRGRGLERTAVRFPGDAAVRRLAQRLAAAAGRRLDHASPCVDTTKGSSQC